MEFIQHWIAQYGYSGIFVLLVLGIVGLPVPDETLLTLAGYLVFRGQLRTIPTILFALLGTICGISISYVLGHTTGYYVLDKYGPRVHVTPERVDRVHQWFKHLGGFTLTFGYYVPGVRHVTAYVAGASKLEYPVFAVFAYAGAAIWTGTFLALGYFLGERWPDVVAQMHRAVLAGCCIAAAIGAVFLVRKKFR